MSQIPFYPSEIRQIDQLVRAALMQPGICQRLLQHDATLCDEFEIAPYTWLRLSVIQAQNLQDFCYQILQQQIEPTEDENGSNTD